MASQKDFDGDLHHASHHQRHLVTTSIWIWVVGQKVQWYPDTSVGPDTRMAHSNAARRRAIYDILAVRGDRPAATPIRSRIHHAAE